jgi:hypothetical protein
MNRLPEERVRLLKMTMPTLPIIPVDLFSRGSDITWDKFKFTTPDSYIHDYPEIIDLKVNEKSGTYDVAAFTNWRSKPVSKEISFSDKLGINSGAPFVVFDFWNQKLEGVYSDKLEIDIEPHDTRVLLIHPVLGHPQLIGNSRHISGAHSILEMNWNENEKTLSGKSETIKGDSYTLFVYLPDGFKMSGVKASTPEKKEVKVISVISASLLKISFEGQSGVINWQLSF